jgi:hypothetical protein
MYQIYLNLQTNEKAGVLKGTNMAIPFVSDVTEYQQFKIDLANGVELKDATGNVMTSQAITEFLQGLQ